ncbi:DUF927 domain-containing protein [Chitinibacter sp. FCG-7]|uniref:DUF927 domain-containing protein n=1 Tax=Chitinibacter mangrovi TaxID=3153927 RepID=A0AAU7F6Q6_9NEIS
MKNETEALSQAGFDAANPDNAPEFVPQAVLGLLGAVEAYYDTIKGDLVYIGVKHDKDHGLTHQAPLRLCRDLEVIGQGADSYGDHYRLIRWRDCMTDAEQVAALPSSGIGEREGWALLNSKGLAVSSNRRAREKLADYLHTEGDTTRYAITQQSGWQYGAFVLPTGEVIGEPERQIFYPAAATYRPAFTPKGTSQSWRDTVGALAKDNPLVMTVVACSLAGALLEHIGATEGFGLHLHTETSSGKSTCGDVAASVWGNPKQIMQSWDGTNIGLTNSAEFANSMMLYLDEIGAGDARKMGSIIYTMLNGVSRTQGRKDGGNRAKRQWLMTLVSTGEVAMSQYLNEGGQTVRGGQEIRLLDMPADGGLYRAFDCIHGCADGGAFSTELKAAARANYGTIGREFVAWLQCNPDKVAPCVEVITGRMLAELPSHAAPLVRRASHKFATLAAALVLASESNLTGWTAEESFQAVCTSWRRWLSVFGLASRDDERLIEQADRALSAAQYGRFVLLPIGEHEPVLQNLMGYKRISKEGDSVFFVLPHSFKDEVTKGYELKKACAVLHEAGMLEKPKGHDGWTILYERGKPRAYKMTLRPCKEGEIEK